MKPIILIVGANHSGTSAIAKFLLDNGAWTGPYSNATSELLPYVKYEDRIFKRLCKPLNRQVRCRKESLAFSQHLKKLPKDKTVIFKYPRAIFCLNKLIAIIEATANHPIKVIYTFRGFGAMEKSLKEKAQLNPQQVFTYLDNVYLGMLRCKKPVLIVSFERVVNNHDVELLLNFCDIYPKVLKTGGLRKDLMHHRTKKSG